MFTFLRRAAWVLPALGTLWASTLRAEPCSPISRENLVRCALSRGLEARVAEANLQAATARVTASDPWLPQNPALTLTAAQRRAAGESALNWSASLAIELEVAGQRGARRASAQADREAQQRLLSASARSTAAAALRAYFGTLAARDARAVLERLAAASQRAFEAARAASERGAASGVEAEVLDATRISVERRKLDAARDEASAQALLASLLGQNPALPVEVSGSLTPLAAAARVRARMRLPDSAELLSLAAERRAAELQASALRRSRVPNPTVSLFVERDGFAEDVVGVGLAFPLPLLEPLGRTARGAIAESEALAQRAAKLLEKGRRDAQAELVRALAAYDAARAGVALLDESRTARAESVLVNLAGEAQSGRLAIRDAIVLQQPLLELLLGAIEAKKTLCLASIEVVQVSGLALDGAEQ
jgi:cobalt-zinc-cadmium efflux system outer membrane protein